jgi:hypothetical protein
MLFEVVSETVNGWQAHWVIVMLAVAVQPLAAVPVTIYVPMEVTVIVEPVAPVLHE